MRIYLAVALGLVGTDIASGLRFDYEEPVHDRAEGNSVGHDSSFRCIQRQLKSFESVAGTVQRIGP